MPMEPVLKKSKGIAYVDFDTQEAAKTAIEQVSLIKTKEKTCGLINLFSLVEQQTIPQGWLSIDGPSLPSLSAWRVPADRPTGSP